MTLVPPTDLRDYLKSQGWIPREEAYSYRLYVLENPQYPGRQLVFPMDSDAPDYLDSSQGVIAKIADLSKSSADAVKTAVVHTKDDVLRLRIVTEQNRDGLPLAFAGSLVTGTQRLLKSTACTVIKPRLNHPRLTLLDAVQLLDKCDFGQTETGSFVIKVSCPVLSMDVQGELDLGLEYAKAPFVRQVTLALYQGLDSLIKAIETDKLSELVENTRSSSAPVLSSNFCEAVTLLQDEGMANSLELTFAWSALYPVPKSYHQSRLRIQADYFPRIEEIRRELRAHERDQEDTFVGTVERLDGEMLESGVRAGEVLLVLLPMEGESIKVRTALDAQQYSLADRAHMTDGAYVRVRGQLRPGRQPRQLINLKLFELLDPQILAPQGRQPPL